MTTGAPEEAGAPEKAGLPVTGGPRIVVGIDGSLSSLGALHWAADQAQLTGAALVVIMAWDWPTSYGWTAPLPSDYDPEESVREVLEEALADVHEHHPDVEVSAHVLRGHPAPLLVDASRGADLLVVGSSGRGEFIGMLLGSVSEHCVTHATCPVLVHRAIG